VDRLGTEWITFSSLVLALPWWVMLVITGPLTLFIISFAIEGEFPSKSPSYDDDKESLAFFTAAVVSPLTAELAVVSRGIEGVGCRDRFANCCPMLTETMCTDAHMYGAFNLAFGVGAACEFSLFGTTCGSVTTIVQ
jgi:hypothetical protein